MTKEKKDIEVKSDCFHHYVVTGWNTKGGIQNATQMRCAHCLQFACLERQASKEFAEQAKNR